MSNPDLQLLSPPADPAPAPASEHADAEPMQQNATGCDTIPHQTPLESTQPHDPPALTSQNDPAPSSPPVAIIPTHAPATTCIITSDATLSPQQQSALWLILSGKTDSAVAASLNLHRSTILRWRLHTPGFAAELHRRRQAIYQAAADRLRTLVIKSLMTLDKALDDRYQETRLQTANQILRLVNTRKLADPAALQQSDLQHLQSLEPQNPDTNT